MVFREFLFFFALVLTTYDALQNSPPRVSDVPQPVPFFRKGSLVTDWYKGELSKAFPVIFSYETSFVMYYAPWDADAQHAKNEFDKAAQILYKKIHFAAINCWHPSGECRLHHVHISVWPIMIVHTNSWRTIMYNGPKEYSSIVRFLQQVINPLKYIVSNDGLLELLAACDAVVIGFIPINNESDVYNIFYNVALKKLEVDPFREICFGVITSELLSREMQVNHFPHIKLMLWNNTLEYPVSMDFNEDNISNWLFTHTNRHTAWVIPSWHKSSKLQKIFHQGSVLIMLTPRNLFYERNPNYDLLREVALEYNNCLGDPHIRKISALRKIQRYKYINYEQNKRSVCKEIESIFHRITLKYSFNRYQNNNAMKSFWLNKTSCDKPSILGDNIGLFSINDGSYFDVGTYLHKKDSELHDYCFKHKKDMCLSTSETSSFNMFIDYDVFNNIKHDNINNEEYIEYETSMLNVYRDSRSSINLLRSHIKDICNNMELAFNFESHGIPVNDGGVNIEGLRCNSNNSLSFIAIDSLLNPHFGDSLGIDIDNEPNKTAIIILDDVHETQYLLKSPFGENSLRQFIYNFTLNLLPRNLRKPVKNSNYFHYYGSDDEFKNQLSTNNNASGEIKNISQLCRLLNRNGEKKVVCIKELNTSTFKSFISQKNKALIVVFCGKGSGVCSGHITLSLLNLIQRLNFMSDQFEIGRIDTTVNDLPWEYAVSKYPTLVFFPTEKKENSRVYPENKPITIEGLLAFVLVGLETPVRLHAQVILCNNAMDDVNMKKCLINVRKSVANLIGNMLRLWRRTNDSAVKTILLRRLQCLRTVAINLGALNTVKVAFDHPVYKSFDSSIRTLSKIWKSTSFRLNKIHRQLINYENL